VVHRCSPLAQAGHEHQRTLCIRVQHTKVPVGHAARRLEIRPPQLVETRQLHAQGGRHHKD
jgi:hypothetical protein